MSDKPKKPRNRIRSSLLSSKSGARQVTDCPKAATGAGLMCYASGVDEAEAVRETVAILKQADMAPLDVTGYGTWRSARARAKTSRPTRSN